MKTLADVTLERFTQIGKEEGWTDEKKLEEFWFARPLHYPYVEEALRKTFREFEGGKANVPG